MRKLLVLSDLHVTVEGATIIGLDPLARLRAVLDHAIGHHPDAEAMILLGDLVHRGSRREYARLAAALDGVPIPVLPLLGNHDRRDGFREVFPDAPRDAGGFVQAVRDIGGHRIVTLDSLDGPPYPDRHHAGRLCPDRLAFLDAALAGASGRLPLVFLHHPPFETGIVGMDAIRLAEGEAVLDRLAAAGAVLFCGHLHRTVSGVARGVPFHIFKSPCHQGPLDLVQVDSTLSIDEPPGYGVLLLTDGGVVVHHQDVGAARSAVARDPGSGG